MRPKILAISLGARAEALGVGRSGYDEVREGNRWRGCAKTVPHDHLRSAIESWNGLMHIIVNGGVNSEAGFLHFAALHHFAKDDACQVAAIAPSILAANKRGFENFRKPAAIPVRIKIHTRTVALRDCDLTSVTHSIFPFRKIDPLRRKRLLQVL